MANNPYPLELNGMPLERYLINLLAALVEKAGGELHIKVSDIIASTDQSLIRYASSKLDEIVLRCAPKGTDMYVVPEAPSWTASQITRQTKAAPQQAPQSPLPPDPQRVRSLTDLDLYLREQERNAKYAEKEDKVDWEDRKEAGLPPYRVIKGR